MDDVTHKRIEEIEPYSGKGTIPGIKFRPAGRALGVTAWGMNVAEIEGGCTGYPEHEHSKDGQEEVYVVLRGSARMHLGAAIVSLKPGSMIRVAPTQKRKIIPDKDGVTVLVIGSTPGKAYEPRR
jgi:mannose-6-phosphate isomerase-like protein (cupin superfamily)